MAFISSVKLMPLVRGLLKDGVNYRCSKTETVFIVYHGSKNGRVILIFSVNKSGGVQILFIFNRIVASYLFFSLSY